MVTLSFLGTKVDRAAMYTKLGTQWCGSMLGLISVALLPIPLLLFRYGKKKGTEDKLGNTVAEDLKV